MILLTGASGFIGKYLLAALIEKYGKANVIAFTSKPVEGSPYLLHNNYQFEIEYFEKKGVSSIDTIIHAGAFTPKNSRQANDREKSNANITNTAALLNARLPQLSRLIYLSTLDVYGNDKVLTENSPVDPPTLYGASKLYCEKMVGAWSKENTKISQVLRIGHVYGPGEEAYEKIIPITMQKLIRDQALQIWGEGNEKRSFIYIQDVIAAILASLELTQDVGPVNIVSGRSITINNLVTEMIRISGKNPMIEKVPATTPGRDFVFDSTKMNKYLLSSEIELTKGLTEEWRYMKELQ